MVAFYAVFVCRKHAKGKKAHRSPICKRFLCANSDCLKPAQYWIEVQCD